MIINPLMNALLKSGYSRPLGAFSCEGRGFRFHLGDRSRVHAGRRWANAEVARDSLRLHILAGHDVFPAYSGAAPWMVNGVIQVNFQVNTAASGEYSLSANGKTSDPFTVFVGP
jgi:hypothetical protein